MEEKKKGSLGWTIIICLVAVVAVIGVVIVMSTPGKKTTNNTEVKDNRTAKELFDDGEYEKALAAYEKDITADSKVLSNYVGKAKCQNVLGDPNVARKTILDAIDSHKSDADIYLAYTAYADICVENGEHYEAYEILDGAGLLETYTNAKFEKPQLGPHMDSDGYYVYGEYPTYIMDSARINNTIINAEYDENDIATVYGMRIARYGEGEDAVYFGFEQVKWKVLKEKKDSVVLQTKDIIDNTCFNETYEEIHYQDSTLRTWLTGTFLDILTANVDSSLLCNIKFGESNNPDYNKRTGIELSEKCTILAIEDVVDGAYGYEEGRKLESPNRCSGATEYASEKGVFVDAKGNSKWMLRTSGCKRNLVAVVGENGIINCDGYYVNGDNLGVRPVIRIYTGKEK